MPKAIGSNIAVFAQSDKLYRMYKPHSAAKTLPMWFLF